jgi:hypothetical protein
VQPKSEASRLALTSQAGCFVFKQAQQNFSLDFFAEKKSSMR